MAAKNGFLRAARKENEAGNISMAQIGRMMGTSDYRTVRNALDSATTAPTSPPVPLQPKAPRATTLTWEPLDDTGERWLVGGDTTVFVSETLEELLIEEGPRVVSFADFPGTATEL